jgi:hypothetical protein
MPRAGFSKLNIYLPANEAGHPKSSTTKRLVIAHRNAVSGKSAALQLRSNGRPHQDRLHQVAIAKNQT